MTDPRSALTAAAEAAAPSPPQGVRALLASVHRDPELSRQVRLETTPLPPVLWTNTKDWFVTALLTEGRTGTNVVDPAWGAATWRWPTGDLVKLHRWKESPPVGFPRMADPWPMPPTSAPYRDLLDAIDRAGDEPSLDASAKLTPLIRAAAPPPAIACYAALLKGHWSPSAPSQEAPPSVSSTATSQVADAFGSTLPNAWLREASTLAASYHLDSVEKLLEDYRTRRSLPSFRAAVVGEFNRGKTTLINDLLGRDLLPVGPVPVTRTFVVVRHGREETLEVSWPDGRKEHRPLGQQAFADLILDHNPAELRVGEGQEPPPEPNLSLTVHQPWLQQLELELIDTPGTNEGRMDRVLQVRRAVALSDLVILAISALSPLSLSEQRLLEDEVLRRHVAHLVVVVTMLDLIDPEERQDALDGLISRLKRHAPGVLVLESPGPDADQTRLTALRAALTSTASRSDRASWRNRRLALQVADSCEEMVELAHEAAELARLDAEQRAEFLRVATHEVTKGATAWTQLGIDLDSRRIELISSISRCLSERARDLSEALTNEAERTHDPNTWWERDLPFRLRRELQVITNGMDAHLTRAIAADISWLEQQITAKFSMRSRAAPPTVHVAAASQRPAAELVDLTRRRQITRLAAPAGTLLGAFAAVAAGAAMPLAWTTLATVVGGLLGEWKIGELTSEQRIEVHRLVTRTVDETFQRFADDIDRELAKIYSRVLSDLKSDQEAWRQTRLAILATGPSSTAAPDWSQLELEATRLRDQIRNVLNKLPATTDDEVSTP